MPEKLLMKHFFTGEEKVIEDPKPADVARAMVAGFRQVSPDEKSAPTQPKEASPAVQAPSEPKKENA